MSALARVVLLGAPGGTSASAISSSRIDLSWTAVVGAASYRVYRGGVLVDSPAGATSSSTGLTASTQYSFQVATVDTRGLEGPKGSAFTASTLAVSDTTAPTTPVIAVANVSSTSQQVTLTTASSDAGTGVASYTLERATNSTFTANLTTEASGLSIFPRSVTGLSSATTYYYRARATDAAGNVGANSTTVSATTSAASTGVLFNPGDLGNYANPRAIFTQDVNSGGPGGPETYAVTTLQSTVTRPGGSSKCIQIQYSNDEAGVELYPENFTDTPTLYIRWLMMLGAEWKNHWPVGLKTTRSFTRGTAYHSAKMVWTRYANPESGFNPDYPEPGDGSLDYPWGCCSAAYNLDVGAKYQASTIFNNGLPYLRAGYWYIYEIYQKMNSADGVGDGELEMRIDRQTVYSNTEFKWVDSSRGATGDLSGFYRMWFGGNISAADGFTSPVPLNRYEDDYFLSTDAQWL